MPRLVSSILVSAIAASMISTLHAEDCTRALIRTTYNEHTEVSRDYRLSVYVLRDDYDKLTHDGSGQTEIYGVPIGASYKDYHEEALRRVNSTESSLREQLANNVLWTGLGPDSLKAYEACLNASSYGLFLYPGSATETAVEIVLRFNPTNSSDQIALSWSGGTPEIRAVLPPRVGLGRRSIIILRPTNPNQAADILLAVSASGIDSPPAIRITGWPESAPPLPTAPCVKNNKNGQCMACTDTLSRRGIQAGTSISLACDNVVPNGRYVIIAKGELVGYAVMELLGPKRQAFSPRVRNGVPGSSTSAAAFLFPSPIFQISGNTVEGTLAFESCDNPSSSCTIAGDARWSICLVGQQCPPK